MEIRIGNTTDCVTLGPIELKRRLELGGFNASKIRMGR